MPEKNELTAIVLAGGKSTRMKQDKGLISLHGKMMIEHVIGKMIKIAGHIIIITQNPAYRQFGFPCYKDSYKDKGPLAGIYTGLLHSTTQKNLVVGCDTPFLSGNMLKALIKSCSDEDVLITEHEGKAEPLCAIYDRNCIPHFHKVLKQDKLKITDAISDLKTVVINFDRENWMTKDEFANINTPEELNKFDQSIK